MHEVISAILITILFYNLSKSLDNIQKAPSTQTVSSSEVISDNSHWSVQSPSSFLSSIDLLRLGSILLDLQEQWWVASNADGRLADSNLPPSAVSRLHTSYDDLRAWFATLKVTWVRSSWAKRDSSTRRTPWPDSATSRATERSSTKTSSDRRNTRKAGCRPPSLTLLRTAKAECAASMCRCTERRIDLHVVHSALKHDEPCCCIKLWLMLVGKQRVLGVSKFGRRKRVHLELRSAVVCSWKTQFKADSGFQFTTILIRH